VTSEDYPRSNQCPPSSQTTFVWNIFVYWV